MIGIGIDAKRAPNFPGKNTILGNIIRNHVEYEQTSMEIYVKFCWEFGGVPNIEKKIMKPADIWITLRLPTLVNAKRPAFSLCSKSEECT